jgi:hypothetical protein
MIFRNKLNKLVDIKQSDYISDKEYYSAILLTKKKELHMQDKNEKVRLLSILQSVPYNKKDNI